jgi:hypothetical protein
VRAALRSRGAAGGWAEPQRRERWGCGIYMRAQWRGGTKGRDYPGAEELAGGWCCWGVAGWGRRRSEATGAGAGAGAGAETVAGRGRAAGRGEMK